MARKTFLGMPMRWDLRRALRNYWNPHDDRLMPPKFFGIGWDLNLHALLRKTGLISGRAKGPRDVKHQDDNG